MVIKRDQGDFKWYSGPD